jgi:hypothetical protein
VSSGPGGLAWCGVVTIDLRAKFLRIARPVEHASDEERPFFGQIGQQVAVYVPEAHSPLRIQIEADVTTARVTGQEGKGRLEQVE